MQYLNFVDSDVQEFLATLSERQIATLLLNLRMDPLAYPPASARTQLIRDVARQEIQRRRRLIST